MVMGERRGTKALETWCRRVTQGYPGVKVENMTTSWRDGLAFCALIHHFRPDLIDFGRLDKSDVYANNELAFRIAERHLGIPALLDAEDMAEYPVPDRLSILTYLSQFYQAFASNSSSPVKKASSDSPDGSLVSLVQGNVQPTPKMEWSVPVREPCAVCNLPVFIAQKLRVGNQLFHRTCFKCARCGAQLSLADYYETCSGQYVCETCPDEMASVDDSKPASAPLTAAVSSPADTPLPTTPPEPPPSLVAMRRLMFETDDAKLTKIDHSVNTSRLVHSVKKDLSINVDTSSPIDKDEKEGHVNIDIEQQSKDSPSDLVADSSFKDSKSLVECVNSSTIPDSLSHPETETNTNKKEIIPCSNKEEDDDIQLVINESNLDLSNDTPSFNDNSSSLNIEKLSLHSESDNIEQPKVVDNVTIESKIMPDITSSKEEVVEAVNPEIRSPIQTSPKIPPRKPIRSFEHKFKSEVKKEEESKSNVTEYPEDLNPFGGDSDEEVVKTETKVSTNPFGSDSEEDEAFVETKPPTVAQRKLSLSMRSTASTNPFDSDDDDEETTTATPVPLPRKSCDASPEPTPFPRRNKLRTSGRSITSLSSIGSYSSTSPRKKKPAPPPPIQGATSPQNLAMSSRYSSMTSIASTRSRKTKRAPLPPSPAKSLLSSLDNGKLSDSPNISSDPLFSSTQIDTTVSKPNESCAQTSEQILSEIEVGMQKLIAKDDDDLPVSTKVEKDLINESSKSERVLSTEIEEVEVTTPVEQTDVESIVIATSINKSDNGENRSIPSEDIAEPEVPNIVTEEISFVDQSSDGKINENVEDLEIVKQEKTDSVVEAFNKELATSFNSFQVKFDNPVHSTPLKVIPALSMVDSSLEDVASGNSAAGSPYLSSPSTSCPDASPYQESLSSPPMGKRHKESTNLHRKISESGVYQPHKSVEGQWKRKKAAPQPPMSLPVRRIVKQMSMDKLKLELSDIEIKQQELERQGVTLEKTIRERFDSESSVTKPVEDLLLQLFELVNEKNELFRKQAELMYIRRQNQLEQEQAELEYQIRCLMARPEENRTDSDKALEETLIGRLIEVVERRDAIVQCLERDRIREVEEDKSIIRHLDKFNRALDENGTKFKKKHKKKKDKQSTMTSFDLDKDLDETEKDSKKKKKWFTLHHKTTKN